MNKVGVRLRQQGNQGNGAKGFEGKAPSHASERQVVERQIDHEKHHAEGHCRNVINQKGDTGRAAGQ